MLITPKRFHSVSEKLIQHLFILIMSKQIGFSKYYKYKIVVYVDILLPNKGLTYAQINSFLFE